MVRLEQEHLPSVVNLLPLRDGILVPRSELRMPLSLLESLTSWTDAIKKDRLVGIVQIREEKSAKSRVEPIFRCGCLGRILDLQEGEDGGLVFSVKGICRFEIEQELPEAFPCRKAVVSYEKYERDDVQEADFVMDRKRLLDALRGYSQRLHLEPNWEELEIASNERLMSMLMMVFPFSATERQTVFETVEYTAQSRIAMLLMEMNAQGTVSTASH